MSRTTDEQIESARRLAFPDHRALLGEFRSVEYLQSGASGSGYDDIVMAPAVHAAPVSAPVALGSQILPGSQVGGIKRR